MNRFDNRSVAKLPAAERDVLVPPDGSSSSREGKASGECASASFSSIDQMGYTIDYVYYMTHPGAIRGPHSGARPTWG
jgi:hypothetical protein